MKVITKHFQYTGTDDFDIVIDEQINRYIQSENISSEQLISIKYASHANDSVATYSALLIYKK